MSAMKLRASTPIFRIAVVLLYWTHSSHAFQSILGEVRSISKHNFESVGRTLGPYPKRFSPGWCSLCATPHLKLKSHRPAMFQQHRLSKSSSLFADPSSASTGAEAESKKKSSFLSRLGRVILFPLRSFIFNPLKLLAELVVDDLDDDGTLVVAPRIAVDATYAISPSEVASISQSAYVQGDAEDAQVENVAEIAMFPEEGIESGGAAFDPVDRDSDDASMAANSSESLGSGSDRTIVAASLNRAVDPKPRGNRWAVAAPGVDLSGDWELIVTDDFRKDYDHYLAALGQPLLVRTVALSIIGQTTEETKQADDGKSLLIRGKNVRGVWDRTLVASGADAPLKIPVMTADSETVEAESWWEEAGSVHVSWLRGVTKYGGGCFESRRYLDDDKDIFVCEGSFHPNDERKEPSSITWRFRRQITENA